MRFVTYFLAAVIATAVALFLRHIQQSEADMLNSDGALYLQMSYNITQRGVIRSAPEFSADHGRIIPPGWPLVLSAGPALGLTPYQYGRLLLPILAGLQAAFGFLLLRKLGATDVIAGLVAMGVMLWASSMHITYLFTEPVFCTLVLLALWLMMESDAPHRVGNVRSILLAALALVIVFFRPAGLALFPALLVVDLIRSQPGLNLVRAAKIAAFWVAGGIIAFVAYQGYVRTQLATGGVPDDVVVYTHSRTLDGNGEFGKMLYDLSHAPFASLPAKMKSLPALAALDWPGYRASVGRAFVGFYRGLPGILFALSVAGFCCHFVRAKRSGDGSAATGDRNLAALHGFALGFAFANSLMAAYVGAHPLFLERLGYPSCLILLLASVASLAALLSALLTQYEKTERMPAILGLCVVSLGLVLIPGISARWHKSFYDTIHGDVNAPELLSLIARTVPAGEIVATPVGLGGSEYVVAAGRFQTFVPDDFETTPVESWRKSINFLLWPLDSIRPIPHLQNARLVEVGRYKHQYGGQILFRIEMESTAKTPRP